MICEVVSYAVCVLEPVFTSVYKCLFGKFCCILREKYLPGDSPPAYFCLACNKIMLENPHIFLVKTSSYNIRFVTISDTRHSLSR